MITVTKAITLHFLTYVANIAQISIPFLELSVDGRSWWCLRIGSDQHFRHFKQCYFSLCRILANKSLNEKIFPSEKKQLTHKMQALAQKLQNQASEKIKMDLQWLGLIIPGSYILVSTFFLCFPNILHRRHKYKYQPFNDLIQTDSAFCIGHRGGGWEGPENTLELFHRNDTRLHMFELDVCLTKDKRLVVHHDSNLGRTCGVAQEIAELDYKDLPAFKEEFRSFGGPVLKSVKNKIPLLEQVFEQFPRKPMNIELKYATEDGIAEFNRIVRKFKREDITVWGAAGSLNEKLRQSNPETVNFYSAGEVLKIFFLFLTGLLPFVCIRQGVLDIPLYTDGFYKMAMNFTDSKCFKCLIFFVFLILRCFNFFSYFFIRHLKKRGILTFYFILNSEEDYDNALAKGCSGIMTDVTQDLERYLKNKNIYYNDPNTSTQNIQPPTK